MICFKKNWKNQSFSFFSKIDADLLPSNARFSNLYQKIQKLSSPVLWKRFEIKSHQRRAHYLKPRRNGRPIPTGGGSRSPPPHWLGLSYEVKLCFALQISHFEGDAKNSTPLPGTQASKNTPVTKGLKFNQKTFLIFSHFHLMLEDLKKFWRQFLW